MRPCDSLFSAFHLLPQEVRRRFRGLLLRAAYGCVLVAAEQHHRAYRIPGADYRGYRRRGKGLRPVRSNVRRRTAVRPNAQPAAPVHQLLKVAVYGLIYQLLAAWPARGYHRVLVAHGRRHSKRQLQRFRVFLRKIPQLPYRRILFQYHFALAVGEYLQRVAFAYSQRPSYFLGYDYAAQLIPLCQVGAKKFYILSGKPFISMVLGDPDGATMRLRGFDRLCYFRSKFDRFAPK